MGDERALSERDLRQLRYLKGLVTVLTATMILGLLTILTLLVIRLQAPLPAGLPEAIRLPDGTRPVAFTQGDGWVAVVTRDDRILIYDQRGRMIQEVRVGQ